MRIASSTIFETGLAGILNQQSQIAALQAQESSSLSVNVPSDNPTAAAEAVGVQQAESLNTQFAANQASATNSLNLESSTLSSISKTIGSIQQELVAAGAPGLTDATRSTIAGEIQTNEQQLVSLGNTQDAQGNYIFGGFETTTPPFTVAPDGTVTYSGDNGQLLAQVGSTRSIATNDPGSAVFFGTAPGTNTAIAYASPNNTGSATLTAGDGGGPIAVTNSADPTNADTFQVSFGVDANGNPTYTVQNLTTNQPVPAGPVTPLPYTSGTAINLGGETVTLSGTPAAGDTFTVRPPQSAGSNTVLTPSTSNTGTASVGAVSVPDSNVLSSYHNYSISYSSGTNQYTVTDTSATPNTTYNVALGAGAPPATTIALGAGQSVTLTGTPANGDTFSVTPPTALGTASTATAGGGNTGGTTVGAVTTSVPVNASNLDNYSVTYSTGTNQFTVTDSSTAPASVITVPLGTGTPPVTTVPLGNDQSVTVTGTPANGDSFTSAQQNVGNSIFTTLNNIVTALKQPGSGSANAAALTNALATASSQIANSLNVVLNVQATVGARGQELQALATDNTATSTALQTSLSNLTSDNVIQTATQIQELITSMEAADKTFAQTQTLTLFSVIPG
jgi:flagellar hook-associated protein 3 FlgL